MQYKGKNPQRIKSIQEMGKAKSQRKGTKKGGPWLLNKREKETVRIMIRERKSNRRCK